MNNQDELEKQYKKYNFGQCCEEIYCNCKKHFKAAWNIQQKKIDELEQRLELANKVVEKMERCVEFYADKSNYVGRRAGADTFTNIKGDTDVGVDRVGYGGKLARATLKEVKELKKGEKE